MPNWCFSHVTLNGSKDSMDKLEKAFQEAFASSPIPTDFEDTWLGNLLLKLGYDEDAIQHGDIRCRGSVTDWSRTDDKTIELDVESAWGPHIYCIQLFVQNIDPEIEMVYTAEEPGNGLYWTNDPAVVGTVYIDRFDNGDPEFPEGLSACLETIYDAPQENVRQALAKYLGHDGDFDTLTKEISEMVEERDPDSYVYFHIYQEVPMEDCD